MTYGYALGPGDGNATWFLNTLMTTKAGEKETNGAFTLIEALAPPNFGPPLHIHHSEDEAFYLLDGSMTVTCGERSWEVGPGGFVYLPRGIPHGFLTSESGPVKMLQFTTPSGFEHFAAEMGEPAKELVLPEFQVPDVERLITVMAKHGHEIAGPPPGQ